MEKFVYFLNFGYRAVDLSLRMSTENSAPVVAAFLRNESPAIKYLDGILCEFGIFFCLADDSSFHGFRGSHVIFLQISSSAYHYC